MTTFSNTIFVRNAFSNGRRGRFPAYWDGHCVRVYDDVAGYYTVAHSLTKAQVRYVIWKTKKLGV